MEPHLGRLLCVTGTDRSAQAKQELSEEYFYARRNALRRIVCRGAGYALKDVSVCTTPMPQEEHNTKAPSLCPPQLTVAPGGVHSRICIRS